VKAERLPRMAPINPPDGLADNERSLNMTNQSSTKRNQPTHRIYSVSGEGDKTNWTPIGAAWPNRDGNGFSITCDAMPLTGRIVMRAITEKPVGNGGQS
jgi:hypothetical protein